MVRSSSCYFVVGLVVVCVCLCFKCLKWELGARFTITGNLQNNTDFKRLRSLCRMTCKKSKMHVNSRPRSHCEKMELAKQVAY